MIPGVQVDWPTLEVLARAGQAMDLFRRTLTPGEVRKLTLDEVLTVNAELRDARRSVETILVILGRCRERRG